MLAVDQVFSLIKKQNISFFTGVPDSLLKDFCAYVTDNTSDADHVIAANEGNAVALAAGHFLGCGEPALVYMQNSGIGNAVNPLTSLADSEVYSIPMLLMIGWRGEPGVKDEPQHVKQGRIMTDLLDALEIPWTTLEATTADPEAVIREICKKMHDKMSPAVILVRADSFAKYKLQKDVRTNYPMNREDAVKAVVGLLDDDDLIISTTGKTSRELYEYRDELGQGHGNDFLTVGCMGHTASIAMGLAQSQPNRRIVCIDGDGSVLMHMGSLAIVGQSKLRNLIHIVINNGAHDSVGGQPTAGFEVDIPGVARACGYLEAISVEAPSEVKAAMSRLREFEGPVMLELKVNKGARDNLGRPKTKPVENRDALMANIGSNQSEWLRSHV